MFPAATRNHLRAQRRHQGAVLRSIDRLWGNIDPRALSESWAALVPLAVEDLTAGQVNAAKTGTDYAATALAATGTYRLPESFADPEGFAGEAADGRRLDTLLYQPIVPVKQYIGRGLPVTEALSLGRDRMRTIVLTEMADAGRVAAGVDLATRPGTGFVRMINPGACSRCAVLAGRFYRWNEGFLRHPRCRCTHQPAASVAAAQAEGFITDPYEYFESLTGAEQDRYFGKANAQAIRDGADLNQVVNAQRGTRYAGISADGTRRGQGRENTTREGTSTRGFYSQQSGGATRRLTPEAIYAQAGDNRQAALNMLERYGYVHPGGQNPEGSIIGQREGYGALGRGGTRIGASEAVRRARQTGVRDPNVRATMTEAERRRSDATLRWQAVQEGRNPYGRGPLTPQLSALAEKDYRHVVVWGEDQYKPVTAAAARAAAGENR